MFSEVVMHAVRHAAGADRLILRATRSSSSLTIMVEDGHADGSRPGDRPLDATGGRGLRIVEALADDWGCAESSRGGKIVWFTIRWSDSDLGDALS